MTKLVRLALSLAIISTLMIILSSSEISHLNILSKISFLCRQSEFLHLIQRQAAREEIFNYIKDYIH